MSYTCGIYAIQNRINGKKYIGSSKKIERRFQEHKRQLNNNYHHNIHLQRSWNKHRENAFDFHIIEEVKEEFLFEREQEYIDQNDGGYNIGSVSGGDNLTNHPNKDEIIKRRSQSQKETYAAKSDEEKREYAEKYKGSRNPNWRGGSSDLIPCPLCGVNMISPYRNSNGCHECRDRTGEKNPFYGRTHSDETKEKIRKVHFGRKATPEQIEKWSGEKSGKFLGYYHTPWGVFPSSSQAQKAHDYMLSATIHRYCLKCDRVIMKSASTGSRFLKENGGHDLVGKTYRDLGFWFEPKQQ